MSKMLRLMPWSEHHVLDIPTLKARIAAGADAKTQLDNITGMPYLLGVAAYYGNVEASRLLLEAGADPRLGRQGLVSPITVAIEGRNSTVATVDEPLFPDERMSALVKTLVQHGVAPDGEKNKTNIGGVESVRVPAAKSPIFSAIRMRDEAALTALIEAGADLNIRADNPLSTPLTPLQYAVGVKWKKGASILEKAVASLEKDSGADAPVSGKPITMGSTM